MKHANAHLIICRVFEKQVSKEPTSVKPINDNVKTQYAIFYAKPHESNKKFAS